MPVRARSSTPKPPGNENQWCVLGTLVLPSRQAPGGVQKASPPVAGKSWGLRANRNHILLVVVGVLDEIADGGGVGGLLLGKGFRYDECAVLHARQMDIH